MPLEWAAFCVDADPVWRRERELAIQDAAMLAAAGEEGVVVKRRLATTPKRAGSATRAAVSRAETLRRERVPLRVLDPSS